MPLTHPPCNGLQAQLGARQLQECTSSSSILPHKLTPCHGRSGSLACGEDLRRGSTGMCPSPPAGFRNRFSTTKDPLSGVAHSADGTRRRARLFGGFLRITSCAIVTGARARGTTRARWRVWLIFPGATSLPLRARWEAFIARGAEPQPPAYPALAPSESA